MMSFNKFLVSVVLGFGLSIASAADMKDCRYSKSVGVDELDNTSISAACGSKVCAAVVLCDNDYTISNVICASTPNGCPKADQCVKEHKANQIVYGKQAATTYVEPVKPKPEPGLR